MHSSTKKVLLLENLSTDGVIKNLTNNTVQTTFDHKKYVTSVLLVFYKQTLFAILNLIELSMKLSSGNTFQVLNFQILYSEFAEKCKISFQC